MADKVDKLDALLEDALQDLLVDDEEKEAVVEEKPTCAESKGKPNIEKSLEKITKVIKDEEDKRGKSETAANSSAGCESTSGSSQPGNKVIDEDEMNRFFASMTEQLRSELPKIDPEEAKAKINESVPQIFDLMQNLLSKELLYPALTDLAPKFDEWLKKNSPDLSKDEKRRYKKQIKKIHEIIEVFDDESINAQERFEKNLELMEQMQSLGAPPEELTVPEGMGRCPIM